MVPTQPQWPQCTSKSARFLAVPSWSEVEIDEVPRVEEWAPPVGQWLWSSAFEFKSVAFDVGIGLVDSAVWLG